MKKIFFILILLFFMLLIPLNEKGETAVINDLITVPTADILVREGSLSAAVFSNKREIEFIYRVGPELEVGLILSLHDNRGNRTGPAVKFKLNKETDSQPAIAAGIKNRDLYIVMSSYLFEGVRGHAGLGEGQFGTIFLGLNKVVNPGQVQIGETNNSFFLPAVNFMLEYAADQINTGIRMNVQSDIYLDFAFIDFADFRAGFSYAF